MSVCEQLGEFGSVPAKDLRTQTFVSFADKVYSEYNMMEGAA